MIAIIRWLATLSVAVYVWRIASEAVGSLSGLLFGLATYFAIRTCTEMWDNWKEKRRVREEDTRRVPKAEQLETEVIPWTWGRDAKAGLDDDCVLWAAGAYQCRNVPREGSKSTPKSSPVQVGSRTKWETKETK